MSVDPCLYNFLLLLERLVCELVIYLKLGCFKEQIDVSLLLLPFRSPSLAGWGAGVIEPLLLAS